MSALGHKRKFAPQKAMSALPPKADIPRGERHFCFEPQPAVACLIAMILAILPKYSGQCCD